MASKNWRFCQVVSWWLCVPGQQCVCQSTIHDPLRFGRGGVDACWFYSIENLESHYFIQLQPFKTMMAAFVVEFGITG